MKRLAAALVIVALACSPAAAIWYVDVDNAGTLTTLWRYGTLRVWSLTTSNTVDTYYLQLISVAQNIWRRGDTVMNYDPTWVTGTLLYEYEYEESGGTAAHTAVYGISSATVTNVDTIEIPSITLRYIPTPTATLNGANVDLDWDDAECEVAGDVTGYKVYKTTDGTTYAYIADSAVSSYTVVGPAGGTYRYAIKLKYRGAPTAMTTTYYGANSNEVVVP